MRIALVCTSLNDLGGKNKHLRNLYVYLSRNGFEIILIICSQLEQELKNYFEKEGVPTRNLILLSRNKKWFLIPFILELAAIFKKQRIQAVTTFDIQSDILGGFASRVSNIKRLYAVFESKVIPENISLPKKIFYKIANLFIRNWFTQTITVSSSLEREVVLGNWRPANRVSVIPVGLDIPKEYLTHVKRVRHFSEKNVVIGTLGRLSWEKGLDRFLEAIPFVLRQIPTAHFIIIGSGPEKNRLLKLTDKLQISSHIQFKGWTDQVFDELTELDIFVLPSVREGCPHSLLEALLLKKPVVASQIEGVTDIVQDGVSGILVDTKDARLFAEKIVYLCQNPDYADKLGVKGREKVLSQFTIEQEVQTFSKMYSLS